MSPKQVKWQQWERDTLISIWRQLLNVPLADRLDYLSRVIGKSRQSIRDQATYLRLPVGIRGRVRPPTDK